MKDWEQPIKKTMLLHNKYEVFYGNDFPKKRRNAGFKCTKPRPPWLSVKWVEMNFEESFLSSGYCFFSLGISWNKTCTKDMKLTESCENDHAWK